ncbi:enoyl-CoA hydratase/isomerase family protein [Desulfobacula sp.]|uniref:enoyl-CoA hydratase/isomerase family protein n=1 Tax=Desulfobacula sp. TaxID=2593537 RepID=UPI00261593C4|nr:enoyl-CoA hydratase/isomerase family protein [Desulfobacula sp.]
MADPKFLKIEKDDQVVRIILDRPKHNVLDIPMMSELNAALETIAADDALKCVVITGEGRSFCAGVEVGDHKPDNVDSMVSTFNRIFELINMIDIPIIAAVNGACLGGGMELAIACDIVIASEKAVFGQPEIKLGFFPPYAALRLPELVGVAKAIEIVTTGQNYTAQQSKDLGFVTQVASVEGFQEAIDNTVKQIVMASPLIIRLNKRAVKRHIGTSFSQGVDLVSNYFLKTLMKTEDTLEGIASFEERRKATWKNK